MSAIADFAAVHGVYAPGLAALAFFVGGFAKGMVGFALPMIAIGGLGAFLPPETAVGLLIAPVLASNGWQALRTGLSAARSTFRRFLPLYATLLPTILLVAQTLRGVGDALFFAGLGAAITAFVAAQAAGLRFRAMARRPRAAMLGAGLVGGAFGGLAGVWGPPLTMYLIACETPKAETMRALGLAFTLGSVALLVGHLASGVFDAAIAPVSLAMIAPTAAGMAAGYTLHDRLRPEAFRRATLAVLLLSGLNLLRRGLLG